MDYVKFEDRTEEVKKDIGKRLNEGLKANIPTVGQTLDAETPYLEGKLRASNTVFVDPIKHDLVIATGGPGARHANLVLFGTRHHPQPNDYLQRTARKSRGTVEANVKRSLM